MAEKVEVYDFDSKEVILMDQTDLGPHMVRINLEGNIYWADSNQLQLNDYQHAPFRGETKERIIRLQQNLKEVYYQTYEEWEDGFRRDKNPIKEISIWEHIVSIYQKFSSNVDSPEARYDIYQISLVCSYSEANAVLDQVELKSISKELAQSIIQEYYK